MKCRILDRPPLPVTGMGLLLLYFELSCINHRVLFMLYRPLITVLWYLHILFTFVLRLSHKLLNSQLVKRTMISEINTECFEKSFITLNFQHLIDGSFIRNSVCKCFIGYKKMRDFWTPQFSVMRARFMWVVRLVPTPAGSGAAKIHVSPFKSLSS
jgi:hypothetical protein